MINIQQQIDELQAKLDDLKAQAAKCRDDEIDWPNMIGRLVEIYDQEDHTIVCKLSGYDKSREYPFEIYGTNKLKWRHAKLYQGPTRPNWIEWSGGECPVDSEKWILAQERDGGFEIYRASDFRWGHIGYEGDIMRYTVIEP